MDKMTPDILLFTADPARRHVLSGLLESGSYIVDAPDSPDTFNEGYPSGMEAGVAVLDYSLPPVEQAALTRQLRQSQPATQIIVLSAEFRINTALKISNDGAFCVLPEPFENEELLYLVARGTVMHQLAKENAALQQALRAPLHSEDLVVHSEPMRTLLQRLQKVSALDATVLLTGESGTGKTLLASILHQNSPRRDGPFTALSCANFPHDLLESELFGHEKGSFTGASASRPGTIELCHRGTLFLDEIGDLPLDLQPKLLTVLQDRQVRRIGSKTVRTIDVRIICATNRDLSAAVEQGEFREDLYYRINVLSLCLPPLRKRREDIPDICTQILNKIARKRNSDYQWHLNPRALDAVMNYDWPGNIRELEHTLERATAFGNSREITVEDLSIKAKPARVSTTGSLAGMTLKQIEEMALREALVTCNGDKEAVARSLGISLKTVYNKLKEYKVRD